MGTRGRLLLGLIVAGWVGVMVAVWRTAPRHVDGPYTQTMARHIYAGFGLILMGLVAIPLVSWLLDRPQRQPRELRWRLILLLGVVLAFAIGAVGIVRAVHPENRTDTYTQRRDSTLDEYGLAAVAVVLATGLATARALPRAPSTTIPELQARSDH